MEQAASFLAVMNKAQKSVRSQLSQAYNNQVQLNTRAPTVIIDSIQFLVKQGPALRGGNWDEADKSEDGNFTSLLEFMKKAQSKAKIPSPKLSQKCTVPVTQNSK